MPPLLDCCTLCGMVDIGLVVQVLRDRGHRVGNVIPVPDNAGDYEIDVDGNLLTLEEARHLLEVDGSK
jgi:hypothetical protein